jgi:hypothetical protein
LASTAPGGENPRLSPSVPSGQKPGYLFHIFDSTSAATFEDEDDEEYEDETTLQPEAGLMTERSQEF